MRFLEAGRVQAAMGSPRAVTPYNCFVMGTIPDSMSGIMKVAAEAAETMRLGGGVGYDFSTIRPRSDLIRSLDSKSSGPVSFMGIFDALCQTIASAGHRRGAQMAVLRVDHPDIEEFIAAKANDNRLTNFNVSVGITDEFMEKLFSGAPSFDLRFEGRVYRSVNPQALWDKIMRVTWDWAEPGVLFIDRINAKNNLWYCETIAATNPCGEQPLPPHGACLLGSFNLPRYLTPIAHRGWGFNWDRLRADIPIVVRGMDNIIDRAIYPLPEQEESAKSKRRMGLGVTGLANTLEALYAKYGTEQAEAYARAILSFIRNEVYRASINLAKEKGPFPLYDPLLLESGFAKTLPEGIREDIRKYGLRNSHLLSIAPTGTISLTADNVSSGIEPVFSHSYTRKINTPTGVIEELVQDYGYGTLGVKGVTADELTPSQHVRMLNIASEYVDSACSKTCNIGSTVTWAEFKQVYVDAYRGGASGCTTFRAAGKRYGILNASKDEEVVDLPEDAPDELRGEDPTACYFDPSTGLRSCE
jgi:ribonucleoside-diphosphate reductase alpha chain